MSLEQKAKEWADNHFEERRSNTGARAGYIKGAEEMRKLAIQAFDEMCYGTEENPAPDEFEPDMDYHRKNFIKKLTRE